MAENYIVSARKYRPQTFDTVVGQEHITTTLKNAIRYQHLAHAYLFCGPRGVGKTTCARILAKTINCEHPTADMEACNECSSCISFRNSASFNIFELDAASNNSVEDIRELVNQVRFAPQQGRYKIYIIDEVHMLSAAAFNAFLKTLEEPPSYAIFILATTEKHKILPTILSRCQIFDFKRITTQDIVNHLHGIATKEGMVAQEAALHVVAQKSEGCMRDALSMLDRIAGFTNGQLTYTATMEHLNMLDADFYFKLTDYLLAQDISGALLELDGVLERGFEGNVILEGLAEHMRNLLLCKDQRMARLLDVPNDHKGIYFQKSNQAPPSFILSALNLLNEAELNYKTSTNKRLHVEMSLIRLCYMLQATSTENLKKNNSQTAVTSLTSSSQSNPQSANQLNSALDSLPQREERFTNNVSEVNNLPLQSISNESVNNTPPTPVSSLNLQQSSSVRRISKNIMDDIDAAVTNAAPIAIEKKELTEEMVQHVYEQYKQKLQSENKSVYHAQFSSMKAEMASSDEIKIVAPNELTEEYAKEQRNQLLEYFRSNTGIMVRVTTEVRKDENALAQHPAVLSKNEIFEVMAQKNPSLRALKEALNLQIEY